MSFLPGQRVHHKDYGNGIILSTLNDGYVKVFFSDGERSLSEKVLEPLLGESEKVLYYAKPDLNRLKNIHLSLLAHSIPITNNAISLTSAKIDLLPHQIVLTHKVSTSFPRRFLIADEVGLGKTIETAMILRELSSRGELNRALMVVPAGLVNNWHRELNEVFQLNFEVFGSEGDVTDRKSNAFQKHNFLIASIDTLKKPERMKKLLAAPKWDLVVFDEAHHLTAYKSGNKIKKTENYKLAELLKDHSRDFLILSATPHQGDHYRFWMMIQLLDSNLFKNPDEMLSERHRLNHVVIRRTKADACKADGSTLFARRFVNTEAFTMTDSERRFYHKLNEYLEDGFDLAKNKGNEGRAIGFVMAIFQKISASSFAAVYKTLRRRLISLTIRELITFEELREVEKRNQSYQEAIRLVREEYNLNEDPIGIAEAERLVIDFKRKILKKIIKDELESDLEYTSESQNQSYEDDIFSWAQYSLPEEKKRIYELLEYYPNTIESKANNLLYALGNLWKQNPNEKIVIFATYLGTVEMLGELIQNSFPEQGVVVLKGGDHSAKQSAENKFKKKPGPNVMICTAAGREGINLQHARILFNFDLPWNPMDLEQRIGRIHRYGQMDTAQVYNLVLADTIEGKIFLLLDSKLKEIAKALGKMQNDQISEDFQAQILGQLSEKINYEKMYRDALSDPELRRTSLELEIAMQNAKQAREVVFELFQDLEKFNLEDYKKISEVSFEMEQLVQFLKLAIENEGGNFVEIDSQSFKVVTGKREEWIFSKERTGSPDREVLGIDHPIILKYIEQYKSLDSAHLGVLANWDQDSLVFTVWYINSKGLKGDRHQYIIPIILDDSNIRVANLEEDFQKIFQYKIHASEIHSSRKSLSFLHDILEPTVQREIQHRGYLNSQEDYQIKLIAWIELKNAKEETFV